MLQANFTFAKQIFHGKSVSIVLSGTDFNEKSTQKRAFLFTVDSFFQSYTRSSQKALYFSAQIALLFKKFFINQSDENAPLVMSYALRRLHSPFG